MGKLIDGGIFAKMEFPPYKYEEYPKLVDSPSGQRIAVNNAREELEVASRTAEAPEAPALVRERDELAQTASDQAKQIEALQRQLAEITGTPAINGPEPEPEPAKAMPPATQAGPKGPIKAMKLEDLGFTKR